MKVLVLFIETELALRARISSRTERRESLALELLLLSQGQFLPLRQDYGLRLDILKMSY